MRYEVRLARGRTVKEFEKECNRLAQVRQGEIDAALDRHEDVVDMKEMWFKPDGPVGYEHGQYFQVWTRWI